MITINKTYVEEQNKTETYPYKKCKRPTLKSGYEWWWEKWKSVSKSNETKIAELTNSYHKKLNEGKQYGIKKGTLMGVAHDRDIIVQ